MHVSGAGSQIAAMQLNAAHLQRQGAESDVTSAAAVRDHEREEQAKAVEEAKEAASDSSMWGDVVSVAKTTAIVASVAAVGVSGGSSLVVAGALVGGGMQVGAEVAGKAGVIDENTAKWTEMAGAGIMLASGGLGAAGMLGETSSSASTFATGARVVSGGATMTEGGASIEKGRADAAVVDAHADGQQADNLGQEAAGRQSEAIDRARHAVTSGARAIASAADIQADNVRTRSEWTARLRG